MYSVSIGYGITVQIVSDTASSGDTTEQAQGSPQRQAWDINKEYLQSQYFFVKLAELVNYECLWKKSV